MDQRRTEKEFLIPKQKAEEKEKLRWELQWTVMLKHWRKETGKT
jgi:hypothetical protein